jgi:hypothetical protein
LIKLLPHNKPFPHQENPELLSNRYLKRNYSWMNSGKDALRKVIELLKLDRTDQIFISTTSGSDFVSTCVSVTCFNNCGISRNLEENASLILIIHEFGFENPYTKELLEFGAKYNIPTLEDHAHSVFGRNRKGDYFGIEADFCIASLPKSTSLLSGAILSSKNIPLPTSNFEIEKVQSEAFYSFKARPKAYNIWKSVLKEVEEVYSLYEGADPFTFTFYSKHYKEIYNILDHTDSQVEMGRTHNKGWVSLPNSPFLTYKEAELVALEILNIHG